MQGWINLFDKDLDLVCYRVLRVTLLIGVSFDVQQSMHLYIFAYISTYSEQTRHANKKIGALNIYT